MNLQQSSGAECQRSKTHDITRKWQYAVKAEKEKDTESQGWSVFYYQGKDTPSCSTLTHT